MMRESCHRIERQRPGLDHLPEQLVLICCEVPNDRGDSLDVDTELDCQCWFLFERCNDPKDLDHPGFAGCG